MALRLRLTETAQDDLFNFGVWIAGQSDRQTARGYIDRIEAACARLTSFPKRGSRRDDLGPGLRSIVVEQRVTIIYEVATTQLVVPRIVPRGQNIGPMFRAVD